MLIDFGVVKEIPSSQLNQKGGLVSSVIIGTPPYIAPERSKRQSTLSSDIYSLGIIAIQAITGLDLDPQNIPQSGWADNIQISQEQGYFN